MKRRSAPPRPERPDFKSGFAAVDRADDPRQYMRFLDSGGSSEWSRNVKRRTFELLGAREGGRFLDVGCGTGGDVLALARLVGPEGRAVGVDVSETMVEEARRRAEGTGLPAEFHLGDAHRLEFPDGAFDGCRAERVFQHLEDPARALGEMVRAVRPGGRVVVFDPDWETFVLDAGMPRVTRLVLNAVCGSIRNGWIGRRLAPLFREHGLVEISVVPDTLLMPRFVAVDAALAVRKTVQRVQEAGLLTPSEGAAWLADVEERERTGRFFAAVTTFCVSGRRPA